MMDNIFVRTNSAGNIKPDKEKSTEEIDGAVATIMVVARAIRAVEQVIAVLMIAGSSFFIFTSRVNSILDLAISSCYSKFTSRVNYKTR